MQCLKHDREWIPQSPVRWPCRYTVKGSREWRWELEYRMKITVFKQLKTFSWKLELGSLYRSCISTYNFWSEMEWLFFAINYEVYA